MKKAIDLAAENVRSGRGGPFGALVVRDEEVVASGVNLVTGSNDPTAHAEIIAIRAACQKLGSFQLTDCELYTSCEPCPMCLGAIYWARLKRFYYASSRDVAAAAGFDDAFIYNELSLLPDRRTIPGYRLAPELARKPFDEWAKSEGKRQY